MRKKPVVLFLFLVFSILAAVPFAHAETQSEILKQYISDLQSNPNDNYLREKIIKHVQTMKPVPIVPEEAERYMARGTAAVKSAKDANDFKDAVREFEKASLAAPWLANVYYNLGIAQDKAGMYADAIKSLKLYLIAVPDASDAKKLIYEIEYRKEKAAKESSPEVIAEKKKNTEEEFIKKLSGSRFVYDRYERFQDGTWSKWQEIIGIQGGEVRLGHLPISGTAYGGKDHYGKMDWYEEKYAIKDRQFIRPANTETCRTWGKQCYDDVGIISEDGNTINFIWTLRYTEGSTEKKTWTFQRER